MSQVGLKHLGSLTSGSPESGTACGHLKRRITAGAKETPLYLNITFHPLESSAIVRTYPSVALCTRPHAAWIDRKTTAACRRGNIAS